MARLQPFCPHCRSFGCCHGPRMLAGVRCKICWVTAGNRRSFGKSVEQCFNEAMNKPTRWILTLLAVFVVLSFVLSAALLLLVDPNDYRDEISTVVTDATGRSFAMEGELSLKTFPCCGIELGALELGNPPGFPEAAFARVESAAVDLQLWPLLTSRELRIGDIQLTGLKLNMLGLADGTNNWEFAMADDAAAPPADAEAAALDLAALEYIRHRNRLW